MNSIQVEIEDNFRTLCQNDMTRQLTVCHLSRSIQVFLSIDLSFSLGCLFEQGECVCVCVCVCPLAEAIEMKVETIKGCLENRILGSTVGAVGSGPQHRSCSDVHMCASWARFCKRNRRRHKRRVGSECSFTLFA